MNGPTNPVAELSPRWNSGGTAIIVGVSLLDYVVAPALAPSSTVLCLLKAAIGVLGLLYVFRSSILLDASSALVFGVAVQYLVAPAIANILWQRSMPDSDMLTEERTAVRVAYPEAMSLVLVFLGAYCLINAFVSRHQTSLRVATGTVTAKNASERLLTAVLIGVLWVGRVVLFAKGAYFHANRTEYQFESSMFSIIATYDSVASPVILLYLFCSYWFCHSPRRVIPGLYLLAEVLYNGMSGGRERTLLPLIAVGVLFALRSGQLSKWFYGLLTIASIALIGVLGIYRVEMIRSVSASGATVEEVGTALSDASRVTRAYSLGQLCAGGIERLNDLDSVAAIRLWVPSRVDYLRGETYSTIPSAFVPRPLWPEKPIVVTPINRWFFRDEGGSSPITVFGEGFLNFGYLGVIGSAMAICFAFKLTEHVLLKCRRSGFFLPVTVVLILFALRCHTASLAVVLSGLSRMILFMVVVFLITRHDDDVECVVGDTAQWP